MTTEIRPRDGQEKLEAIAYRMYLADFVLHFDDTETPLPWDQIDSDEKFAWMYIASAGLREIAMIEDFQKEAVLDCYRGKSPYPIQNGETWDSVTSSFFQWGYDSVFFTYNMPSDDASGLNA